VNGPQTKLVAKRLLVATAVLLAGLLMAPLVGFPSEPIAWQRYTGLYDYFPPLPTATDTPTGTATTTPLPLPTATPTSTVVHTPIATPSPGSTTINLPLVTR
jgi:hypothetical protein